MKVGARELKNRFGHYLRQVKAGQTVHVTDRGKIVAELKQSAPPQGSEEEALQRLAAEGEVTLGPGQYEDVAPQPIKRSQKLTSQIIIDERR
jgi:antitoxin (DNA-binding transcriptional repressor) of toxin-antitoxin stability system